MEQNTGVRPEWLSYKDAQTITGLSRGTLWKLAVAGRIVVSRQGRAVRLLRRSIDDLMWQGTVDVGAAPAPASDEHVAEDQR